MWNQKTGARATNYGSRVDFILAAGPKAAAHSPVGVAHAEEARTGGANSSAGVAHAEEAMTGAAAGSPATTECPASSTAAVDTSSAVQASSAASEQVWVCAEYWKRESKLKLQFHELVCEQLLRDDAWRCMSVVV